MALLLSVKTHGNYHRNPFETQKPWKLLMFCVGRKFLPETKAHGNYPRDPLETRTCQKLLSYATDTMTYWYPNVTL